MIEMRRSCEMTSLMQGGSRPMGGYQTLMGPSSPAPAPPSPAQAPAWQYQSVMPKQEHMDHDGRNDSGMDSGSELIPYSPDSNRGGNLGMDYSSRTSQATTSISPSSYYTNPVMRHMRYNSDHNPLTPPDSEPMASPVTSFGDDKTDVLRHHNTSMTCTSTDDEIDDPIKRLEKICSSSRKSSECSTEGQSEDVINQYKDQGLRTPKINSHGKVKKFKCKQCGFLAYTKVDFWNHSREHIKPDKQLTCPKCPFVTEYKHHLEYHLRNHEGKKPHKCPKCPYTCVNKSMLNSHSKSHSNIYQYRCSECSYASKYCHSLKLHSRKYNHEPGVALDEGGSPNPRQIIDVYGTRRGPKVKKQEQQPAEDTQSMLPFPLSQMLMNVSSQMQMPFPGFPFFNGFQGAVPNPLLLQNLDRLMREQREAFPVTGAASEPSQVSPVPDISVEQSTGLSAVPDVLAEPSPDFSSVPGVSAEPPEIKEDDSGVLDLSKPNKPSSKNRRKGPAFKLAPNNDNSSEDEDEDRGETTVMYSTVEAIQDDQSDEEIANTVSLKCQFCDISFGDPIIHTLHMGLHGYDNPFKCNMCGQECKDKVSFYLHLVRVPHP